MGGEDAPALSLLSVLSLHGLLPAVLNPHPVRPLLPRYMYTSLTVIKGPPFRSNEISKKPDSAKPW